MIFAMLLILHALLGILASSGAFVFAAGGVKAVIDREHKFMGGVAVVLLNLVVTHVGILVEMVTLEHIEHRSFQGKGFVFQETLLHHKS